MQTRNILTLCLALLVSMPSADAQSFKDGLKSLGDKIGKQIVKTTQSAESSFAWTMPSAAECRDSQWQYLVATMMHTFKVVTSSHQLVRESSPLGTSSSLRWGVCTQLLRYWLPARTELAKLELMY